MSGHEPRSTPPGPPGGAERRRNPRFAADLAARLSIAGEEQPTRIIDLCQDAVLLDTGQRQLSDDAEVQIRLSLPSGDTALLEGRVVRTPRLGEHAHGAAVLLSGSTPAFVAAIHALQEPGGSHAAP